MVRVEGVGRTKLEDAMLHQACVAWDLDLTAIQMKILRELMGGNKQAKGRALAGRPGRSLLRKGGGQGRPGYGLLQPEAGSLPQQRLQEEGKDVRKLLMARKEGS